jgi:hypothetical protein
MKRVYKNLVLFSLSGLVCLFLAVPAYAQHSHGGGGGGGFHGGGGGGGFHGGGGGGGHASFSGGGHATYSGGGRTAYSGGRATNRTANVNRGSYNGRANYAGHAGNYAGGRANYAGHAGVYAGGHAYGGVHAGVYAHGGYYHPGFYRGGLYHAGGWYGGYHGYGWGGHFGYGGFYWHAGFYNSLYWPRLGFSIGFLPYGYYPFYWGGLQFYYSNGYYYNYVDGQYTVVEPPVGAQINTLPSGAQSVMINGQQYYELNGVYYVPITKDDGSLAYEVAGKDGELNTDQGTDQQAAPPQGDQGYAPAPQQQNQQQPDVQPAPERNGSADLQIGDVVQSLPKDSRGVTVNGQRLFVSPDDVYYKKTTDNNGDIAYKIVGLPSADPDNQ